jgi:hypothetical protein
MGAMWALMTAMSPRHSRRGGSRTPPRHRGAGTSAKAAGLGCRNENAARCTGDRGQPIAGVWCCRCGLNAHWRSTEASFRHRPAE